MPFRNGKGHGKAVHDRSRGMVKEKARHGFVNEHKEIEHEFKNNRTAIQKLFNDGYQFDSSQRSGDRYTVRFVHKDSGAIKDIEFRYEANFTTLETMWQIAH